MIYVKKSLLLFLMYFTCCFSVSNAQNCSSSTNMDASGTGPQMPDSIPKDKASVYFNKPDVNIPTFSQMLECNMSSGQDSKLPNLNGVSITPNIGTKNFKDIFSNVRYFLPSNKDFFNSAIVGDDRPLAEQIPLNNMQNLKLLVLTTGGKRVNAVGAFPANTSTSFVSPSINYQLETVSLVTNPSGAYQNFYGNYMNNNAIHVEAIYNHQGSKPVHVTLTVVPNNFPVADQAARKFPQDWFTPADWGTTRKNIRLNAMGYAMMLARTYSPLPSDEPTGKKLIDVLDIGNEPWGYQDTMVYKAIVDGFIAGFDKYYGSNTAQRIQLITGALQAHHGEPYIFESLPLYNNMNLRTSNNQKCKLAGINIHPYSSLSSAGEKLLAYPETDVTLPNKPATTFKYIRNAWTWLKKNPMAKQDIYVSEFGWDSDMSLCSGNEYVGKKTQAIYTIRNLLMMGRYGVQRASLYEAVDNDACQYAYHSSGTWTSTDAPKYLFYALENFNRRAGNLKFNYAISEQDNGVYAFVLENNGVPSHLVAWLAKDINDRSNIKSLQDLITMSESSGNIIGGTTGIVVGSTTYIPDAAGLTYRLDGETASNVTNTYWTVGTNSYKLSGIPVLIPLKVGTLVGNTCNPDAIPPVFSGCPSTITLNTASSCATATWTAPTATDNCVTPSVALVSTLGIGACFPVGTSTVTYKAQDLSNNSSTCSFNVVVNQMVNPTAKLTISANPTNPSQFSYTTITVTAKNMSTSSALSNIVVNVPFPSGTVNGGTPTASNGSTWNQYCVGGAACYEWRIPSLAANTTATLTVILYLNSVPPSVTASWAQSSPNITVQPATVNLTQGTNPCLPDLTPPVFSSCPSKITLSTSGTCATATWAAPTATDNCVNPTVNLISALGNGACFPTGTSTVTYKAQDSNNNSSICSFNVVVSSIAPTKSFTLTMSASPNISSLFNPTSVTVVANYQGSVNLSNLIINVPYPSTLVPYSSTPVSTNNGVWNDYCPGNVHCFAWSIPSMAANSTASLTLPLYVLALPSTVTATLNACSDVSFIGTTKSIVLSTSPSNRIVNFGGLPSESVSLDAIKEIYPNPATDKVNITFSGVSQRNTTIRIMDMMGRTLIDEKRDIEIGYNFLSFDISTLARGMYVVLIEGENEKMEIGKFIK
jgi:Secretion system C-terminal sorting domain/HYR domain